MSNQILDISHSFFTKREKLIFGPGSHEIDKTTKFRRDGEKRIPDSESATQNYIETTGFISAQFWLLLCAMCVYCRRFNKTQ